LRNGFITFGSLNNAQKISDATLAIWAVLLQDTPSAHLRLVGPHAPSASVATQQILLNRLAQQGLPMDRVTLLPRQSLDDFLALGQHIDIALESFPLSGGVTTAQALWMGLPVIALAGKLPFERAAAAVLHAANHPEWIAQTEEQYLQLVSNLANNPATLTPLRMTQRTALASSPLLNYKAQVQALESIYLRCWSTAAGIARFEMQ
jgi:protein O-GlcNAc transferase